jgi:16S rRNA (guanine527-N7)-methyltransferase
VADQGVHIIKHYFPQISSEQEQQFAKIASLYKNWNEKINVISRQDVEHIYTHHVLHSLAIAKVHQFEAGKTVLDVGTGGGFPGIPLAIMYPDTQFHLVDSIAKKIKVVRAVADALGLKNVTAEQIRAEQIQQKFDYIISRAVTRLKRFAPWVALNLKPQGAMIFLKGGDLAHEIAESNLDLEIYHLSQFFEEAFFETKQVLVLRHEEIKAKFR